LRCGDVFAQMGLEKLAHESVHRPADGRDLLKHRSAVHICGEGSLYGGELTSDPADAGDKGRIGREMGHSILL